VLAVSKRIDNQKKAHEPTVACVECDEKYYQAAGNVNAEGRCRACARAIARGRTPADPAYDAARFGILHFPSAMTAPMRGIVSEEMPKLNAWPRVFHGFCQAGELGEALARITGNRLRPGSVPWGDHGLAHVMHLCYPQSNSSARLEVCVFGRGEDTTPLRVAIVAWRETMAGSAMF
jgi:hypothetical protein